MHSEAYTSRIPEPTLRSRQAGQLDPSTSNSAAGLLSTLVPVLALNSILVGLFLVYRRKLTRVYQPRTYLDGLPTLPQPVSGLFGWARSWASLPDSYLIGHNSIDAYLFLRFLKLLFFLALGGCFITWAILFPINIRGGGTASQFDRLAITNVRSPRFFFAHNFVAWAYYMFVMVAITRETIFYTRLRETYLRSPRMSTRVSTRTVLFTDIPTEFLSEPGLARLFPNVKHVWICKDVRKLAKLVAEREKMLICLENAENKLIQDGEAHRLRLLRRGVGSPADQADAVVKWADEKKRPKQFDKRVLWPRIDTINWSRGRLQTLVPETAEMQQDYLQCGAGARLPAAFVEFIDVQSAELAFQQLTSYMPKVLTPSAIGLAPSHVAWDNIILPWWWRDFRYAAATALVGLTILFWSPITAFIGALSNINYIAHLPSLAWIERTSTLKIGLLTGLVPTAALAAVVALVPILLRYLAKLSGAVSTIEIDLRLQNWYFAFQVIQVFLLVTIGSSATAVAKQLQEHPPSATRILASNLPKASNFYINYFIFQGVTISSAALVNVVGVISLLVLSRLVDNTPRKRYSRASTVDGLEWGTLYPKFSILGVIFIAYSIIAPLILGFAAIALAMVYYTYRYNLFFATDTSKTSNQGRSYARALQHLTVGVYLGEVCLVGLFAVGAAEDPRLGAAPVALMISLIVITALFHMATRTALKRHITQLPRDPPNRKKTSLRQRNSKGIWAYIFQPKLPDLPPKFSKPTPDLAEQDRDEAFLHPAINTTPPLLWIVPDLSGLIRREKAFLDGLMAVSDVGAGWDAEGRLWTVAGDAFGGQDRITSAPIHRVGIPY